MKLRSWEVLRRAWERTAWGLPVWELVFCGPPLFLWAWGPVNAALSETRAGSTVVRFARGFPRKVTRIS